MAEIIIDGKSISFTGKANIMNLAKSVGIEIPGFCYHPGLSVSGNCRMCMVEVGMPAREKDGSLSKDEKGQIKISFMPKLQPACYQEPADGMVILTKSPKVVETRKNILRFLLANHPLDCPICDQAGECVLQDYSFQYGFSKAQFLENKRTYKKTFFSDVIYPEMNRCIHCDRCARFTKEIAHDYSFTRTGRGNCTELATLPGEKITHNYQGNMADICPVGALTLTDFRFKSRTWFLKHSEGLCTSCGKGCNVVYATDKDNKVMRIKPRFNEKVNSYWMCDFGRLRYSFFNANKKIDYLVSGSKVSQNDALEKTADLLRNAKSLGIIASANESLESQKALAAFAKNVIKTGNIDFRVHDAQIQNNKSLKAGEVLLANDPYPNTQGAIESGLIPSENSMSATDMLNNPAKLDCLVVILDDKIIENTKWIKSLSGANNLVIISPINTELDSKCQVALPLPSVLEQSGSFINVDGIEQKFTKIFQSSRDIMTLPEILNKISVAMQNVDAKKMDVGA